MKIIRPPKLNIGDTVGIVSPSQPVTNRRYYQRSIGALRKLGFNVVLGKNALRSYGYMAGTAEERVSDLHDMFANPEVKAIFTSSGGFVSHHLLRYLDYDLIRKNPKIISGFSDITTLLNAIFKKTGLITFYNFSIQSFNEKSSDFTIKSFMDMFVSDIPSHFLPQKSKWKVMRKGKAEGRLIGGNLLTTINNLNLKEFSTDPRHNRGKFILFFEEHGTDLEELDNSLHRLGLAGFYDHLQGIIIGKITDVDRGGKSSKIIPIGDPREFRKRPRSLTVNQIFNRIFDEYNVRIPVLSNVDVGYVRDKISMPIGAMVSMNLNGATPVLKLLEYPVSHP
ncbi:MAG: LD-carboxypeptidase [bacterium]|nr:LD-carboxypeptidase [bacterium]